MNKQKSDNCAICNSTCNKSYDFDRAVFFYNCSTCRLYGIDENAELDDNGKIIADYLLHHPDSNLVCKKNDTPIILSSNIRDFKKNYVEPNAMDLLDNFLSFYCRAGDIGERLNVRARNLAVATKTLNLGSAKWVVEQANSMGWLGSFDFLPYQVGDIAAVFEISAFGWKTFYDQQKNQQESRQAFLALQFSNETLREKIIPEIKSACKHAGFELLAVDEKRRAGLIDNKIRVDIRNSRFVVVDISDQNRGAYFEAGFADGLGKPIFYVCDKIVFTKHLNGEKTIHFDVEHHDIITWDKNNPKLVGEQLLASIRNTLPNEAKMSDT